MITGDKQETAINIGYSCKLLQADMDVMILNAQNSAACKDLIQSQTERGLSTQNTRHALVIDGETLRFVIEDHDIAFLDLALNCQAVIVCRATPIHKANMVKLVRERIDACCLAVGDGANDVSMIQEANVGVGIFGREGTIAARSSDYAITRFFHLKRLLAVHGRYSLIRTAFVVHYSFYKNVAVFLAQLWFGFYCGFSAQSIFDDWLMTLYNIMITALPPLAVGIFEKDISERMLLRYPQLYNRTQSGTMFTMFTMAGWILAGLYHSLVLSLVPIHIFNINDALFSSGRIAGLDELGNLIFTVSVCVVFLKAALEINYWTWITHVGLWGSLLIYFGIFGIESELVSFVPTQFDQFNRVLSMPLFWFWLFLGIILCLLPDTIVKFVQKLYFPTDWEILRERFLRLRSDGIEGEDPYDPTAPVTAIPDDQPLSFIDDQSHDPTSFDYQFRRYADVNV